MMASLMPAMAEQSPAPVAAQVPYIVKSPHGDRADPYYWLRDDKRQDPKVLAYLQQENAYYQQFADQYQPLVKTLSSEIIGRIKQDDSTVPAPKGEYAYYTRWDTGAEYPVYMRKVLKTGKEQVLLDVNQLAKGHSFFQVAAMEVSPNNRLLAYAVDTSGRRQYTLKFLDLTTGQHLPDQLTGVEPSIAWAGDNQHVFFIEKDPQTLLGQKIRRHQLGADVKNTHLVYEEKDTSFYTGLSKTNDDQYIVLWLGSTVSSEMRVLAANNPKGEFKTIAPRQRDFKYQADHINGRWVLLTDWNAPNNRIMTVSDQQLGDRKHWQELIKHDPKVFVESVSLFKDYLVLDERSDALNRIRVLPWNDLSKANIIKADEPVYVANTDTNLMQDTEWLRYSYTSLTTPRSVFEVNMRTGEKKLLKQQEVLGGFDKNNYQTERVWAVARDGVKVPVSLVYRKGFKADGTAPLFQYAYGSYGASMDPAFRSSVISLLDRGFVYAIAHIRGGQEMGRQWYEDGKLLKKINTFNDFIDVTDHLVKHGYAAKDKVFAQGGSAGGLLMGAVANMAGEKYRGMIANVPFVDVVTTMLDESIPLTTNEFDEWGNPKQKAYYDYMLSYSPYDQVKKQAYPAMLVTTGLHDSQVQYFEPAKWVAKLRTHKTDQQPLLFHTNMEAGHGGKSGRFSRMEEVAQEYAFVLHLLGKTQ